MTSSKMLNLTIAMSNVFNPRRQGLLPALSEPLLQVPAHKLAQMIKSGELSSGRLCRLVAERIRQVQPHINCMCQERFEAAFEEAERIDALLGALRSGAKPECELTDAEQALLASPLLGVPISVKESIQVRGMRNTCGLWDRRELVADADAVVVANVRRAGLVPICTTNVPECTLYWADCQNRVYGVSRNPYDLSRITGASSGGEGGLLGSGASLLGLGSDIGGSLRIPAHYCGVNSHKPSAFLLSPEGNFPPLKPARLRMFTLGPMARYASDLKPLLKCLLSMETRATNSKHDSYTSHQPQDISELRATLLKRLDEHVDLSKLKLFYFKFNESSELRGKQSVRVQPELARAQAEVLEHMVGKFGCEIEELNLDKFLKRTLITWQCMIRCAGTAQDRADAYEEDEIKRQFGIESLLMEFIKMPLGMSKHTKESLLILMLGSAIPADRDKAFALCEKFELYAEELRAEMFARLGPSGVLLMPTLPSVAHKLNVSLAKTSDIRFPALFNVLQLPVTHATLRLDEAHKLPFGVSLAARPYNDHLTLALAEEIELAFGGWRPPPTAAELKSESRSPTLSSASEHSAHEQQQKQQKKEKLAAQVGVAGATDNGPANGLAAPQTGPQAQAAH